MSRDHADQTWIVQDSVDDGPVSWSSRHLPSPPCPSAPLRTMLNGRAFYAQSPRVLCAIAARSTRRGRMPAVGRTPGRYLYQRSTKALDLLFVNRYLPPQSAPHRHTAAPRRQSAWRPRGDRKPAHAAPPTRRWVFSASALRRIVGSTGATQVWPGVPPEYSAYPSAVPPCAGLSSWITRSPRWSRP